MLKLHTQRQHVWVLFHECKIISVMESPIYSEELVARHLSIGRRHQEIFKLDTASVYPTKHKDKRFTFSLSVSVYCCWNLHATSGLVKT